MVTVLAALGTPAQAEDTGTIAGRFTDNGAPVASMVVAALPEFGGFGSTTSTDANGEYRIDNLRPGRYRVQWGQPGLPGDLVQYAFGKASYGTATIITVTAGAVTTVDDSRLPSGIIQGRFDSPSQSVRASFWPVDSNGSSPQLQLDYYGNFSARVVAGRYRIYFVVADFSDLSAGPYIQWVGGTDVGSEATVLDVAPNSTVTVNETMLPTGRMAGRFTDAAGNGIPSVEVSISRPDLGRGPSAHTDANGNYSFPYMRVSPQWKVQFNAYQLGFSQYAFGKIRAADADLITIAQGQTTTVSDSRLPTGTVKVVAKDAKSGAGVDKFQADLEGAGINWTQNGDLVIRDVPVGTHPVNVYAYGYQYAQGAATVTVRAGEQSEVTIDLQPATRIEAIAVDAATGQPVEGVCLITAKPQRFVLPGEHCYEDATSGPSGRAMVEIHEPGWFQILAFPMGSQGLGAQWVGPNGGTGSQLGALPVKVEAGKVAKLPTIRLDRAGTITGHVTSPSGAPLPNAMVSLGDVSDSGPGPGAYFTDEQGRYTISNLGPYRWPLRFVDAEPGIQWSGQSGTRLLATPVTVQSGQTTNYDFRFRTPTQVTTNPGVPGPCLIDAFELLTGDTSGAKWVEGDCTQPITLPIVGPQWVKLRVGYYENDEWKERFYETRFIR